MSDPSDPNASKEDAVAAAADPGPAPAEGESGTAADGEGTSNATGAPTEQTNGTAKAGKAAGKDEAEAPTIGPRRFGTIQGVYVPSLLTILGVIMYLRLGWVVGEAGLALTVVIVTLATSITFITGLSIAATATNMRVRGGGAYFMVSRSFGVESGAAIGLPLYLAQATGVSFYLAGFAESVHSLLPQYQVTHIGLVALVVLTVLAFVSANLALKTQLLILAVILASLGSLALGGPVALAPDTPSPAELGGTVPFWVVFAVFFPAVTGIEAGMSMSGDLKDPRRSLPLGTLGAVVTGYAVYLVIPIVLWWWVPRAVLRDDPMVLWKVALLPQLMYAGIWGATLSSALGALLGGSRTLQALANDRVVPRFLGRGSGPGNDPRLATVLTFAIAAGGLMLGSLDALAPVLSMFFLTSYGTLNLIAALEELIGNPSWRPTFHTPWRLSLLGSALCVGTMLMIDAGASITAVLACSAVYLITRKRRLRVGWTDIRGGLLQALARFSVYHLGRYQDVARTWRPNILLFSGTPTSRWHLVQLADAITHGKGFLTLATIVEGGQADEGKVRAQEHSIQDYLRKHRVPALVRVKYAPDIHSGAEGLMTDYGLGYIEPNTVMLGATENPDHFTRFSGILRAAHKQRRNLIIVADTDGAPNEGLPEGEKDTVIDVWMSNRNNNATLMLIFAYMLQSSPEWQGAHLTIRSLAPNEEARRGQLEDYRQFLAEARIDAEIDIAVATPGRTPYEEMARYSRGADLVFMGLRAPAPEEADADYAVYYKGILAATRAFPLTIVTLAGEEIAFREVFA